MNAASFIGALAIPAGIVGALTFFLMAIFSQETKVLSRTRLVRSAFVHAIAFVSLAMVIGSVIYLGQEALRATVLKKAQLSTSYSAMPPSLYLSSGTKSTAPETTALTCTTGCDLTDADKQQIAAWREAYSSWKDSNSGTWSIERKRGIVDSISMLIVGGALFIWFFIFIAQRENRTLRPQLGKPIALRTVYFYLVALVSLLSTIVAATLVVNVGLKSVLGLNTNTTTTAVPLVSVSYEKNSIQSVLNCGEKCAISADDQALAKQWIVDYDAWNAKQSTSANTVQSDLANFLPILVITAPLFWYHFARIRKEGHEADMAAAAEPEVKK
jgi:hypothetical protein